MELNDHITFSKVLSVLRCSGHMLNFSKTEIQPDQIFMVCCNLYCEKLYVVINFTTRIRRLCSTGEHFFYAKKVLNKLGLVMYQEKMMTEYILLKSISMRGDVLK